MKNNLGTLPFNYRQPCDIPNVVGYKVKVRLRDAAAERVAQVVRDEHECHVLEGVSIADVIEWRDLTRDEFELESMREEV